MRRRLIVSLAAALVVAGVLAAPAGAAVFGGVPAPFAVLGIDFPSVRSIVEDVVEFFFGTLLDALVPDFLRDATLGALKYLIAAPNPADARAWPTITLLANQFRTVGYALLPVTLTVAVTRAFVTDMLDAGHDSPLRVVGRAVSSGFALVIYQWAFTNSIAAINIVTSALIGLPVVERGLERTVGLVFGAAVFSGGGVLLALLGIVAVVLAIGLFLIKIALFVLFGVWYVAGQFLLALRPLPEVEPFVKAWKFGFVALLAVPIGWCILFALAGALSLDLTGGNSMNGPMGSKLVGAFSTIIVFYLAVRWPFLVLGQIRSLLGPGLGLRGIRFGGGGAGGGASSAVVRNARAKLQRTALAGGRMVMSPLPGGGLVGLGAKAGRAIMPRIGALAGKVPGAAAAAAAVAPAATPLATAAGAIRARARAGGEAMETALRAGLPAAAVAGSAARAVMRTPTPGGHSEPTAEKDQPPRSSTSTTSSTSSPAAPTPATSATSTTTSARMLTAEQRAVMKALGPRGDDPVLARNVRDSAAGGAARAAIETADAQDEPLPPAVRQQVLGASSRAVIPTAPEPAQAGAAGPVTAASGIPDAGAAAGAPPPPRPTGADAAQPQGSSGAAAGRVPPQGAAGASRRSAGGAAAERATAGRAADRSEASAVPPADRRRRSRRSAR